MSIIVSKSGKKAKRINHSQFDSEIYLQQYIYDNPETVPLYEIKEDIQLLILAREFPTNSGPIDAVGIDKDGDIYLIETKLYKNPDKRTVVAQVLDYGASLWKNSVDFSEFMSTLNKHTQKQFKMGLIDKVEEYFGLDSESTDVLLDNMQNNLDKGNFQFVVLMDKLQSRLKDLMIFINENSRFTVYAVELEYYKYESYEILIPKLFGAQVKKDIKSKTSNSLRKKWDEESFLSEIKKQVKNYEIFGKFFSFSKEISDKVNWGTGNKTGSASFLFNKINTNRSVYTLNTNGKLTINFGWLDEIESVEYRDELRDILIAKDIIPNLGDVSKVWYPIDFEIWSKYEKDFEEIFTYLAKK